jgi:hypothetical protein
MNFARCALCTVLFATPLLPIAQEKGPAVPKSPEGNYDGTDPDGNYQKALEAAIKKANDALSDGGRIADQKFDWTVVSVSGTRGGILGKRDVTVRVHATL